MRIDNLLDTGSSCGISGLFYAIGSFGVIDGKEEYARKEEDGLTVFEYTDGAILLRAEFERRNDGIVIRRDSLKNLTRYEIEINSLLSRFCLDGNEYEVYTQFNGWQHESSGAWQRLVTEVRAEAAGVRSCDGATPFMALHNLYTKKNTVLHLVPNAKWQMTARKAALGIKELCVVETGFSESGLRLTARPDETVNLPEIILYRADSRTDLDAYRLHSYYNSVYPRRSLPIIYNSWLYCFDRLDVDRLKEQAVRAEEMGFEAFVVDAGWFDGGADWFSGVGDFEENIHSGPSGRLSELSEFVRERGMLFGLWFEPERAGKDSRSFREHPEYYLEGGLLDFSNPEAVEYILDLISDRIERYKLGFVKFDFNDSISHDRSGSAFYRYFEGQKHFIERLRERFPELYITNCAGGGYRAELGQARMFDSFWISDNQGPCEGIRILKDTLLRMPSSFIERWSVQKYCEGFPLYPDGSRGRMIHCNDATWGSLVGIDDSFSEAFSVGGPMGFSCDIAAFPEEYVRRWSAVISKFKQEREFYKSASARILIDTDTVIAIEYTDAEFRRCVINVFTKTTYAKSLILFPALDRDKEYILGGRSAFGKDILDDGILLDGLKENSCRTIELAEK